MYEQEQDSSWSFGIGLFIGALSGAAIASLFTPRSGQQNRNAAREKGLVLKARMADTTNTTLTSVKDTTSSTVASVKETAGNAVTTVKETASNAVATVKDTTTSTLTSVKDTTSSTIAAVKGTASSAASSVKDTTNTVVSRVSDTAATVKDKAAQAVEKVSETTSTTVSKVQDVASAAAEKARSIRSRSPEQADDVLAATTTEELVAEARYDAEDVRSVAADAMPPLTTLVSAAESTAPRDVQATSAERLPELRVAPTPEAVAPPQSVAGDPLATLATIETFQPTMGTVTPPDDAQINLSAVDEALSEVASTEQFEVTDMGATLQERSVGEDTTGTVDVREASEGADRSA